MKSGKRKTRKVKKIVVICLLFLCAVMVQGQVSVGQDSVSVAQDSVPVAQDSVLRDSMPQKKQGAIDAKIEYTSEDSMVIMGNGDRKSVV